MNEFLLIYFIGTLITGIILASDYKVWQLLLGWFVGTFLWPLVIPIVILLRRLD